LNIRLFVQILNTTHPLRTASYAINSINKLASVTQPWFMAVGLVRPHIPFNCPGRFWDLNHDPYDSVEEEEELKSPPPPPAQHNDSSSSSPPPTTSVETATSSNLTNSTQLARYFGQGTSPALNELRFVSFSGFGEIRAFLPPNLNTTRAFATESNKHMKKRLRERK
jgi:hypothetical protein